VSNTQIATKELRSSIVSFRERTLFIVLKITSQRL